MELKCCLCLHIRTRAERAVTILNGQAVCYDHMTYVQGSSVFSVALAAAKRT